MNIARFVVNVVRVGTPSVRRTVHRLPCVWVGRANRSYSCDAAEAARLLGRAELDGRTVACHYCAPSVALYAVEST